MHNQKTLSAALAYAAHGWAVFPVPPGTKRSYKSAEHSDRRAWGMTREAAEIRADFTRWPDAGIGIPTGALTASSWSRSTPLQVTVSTARTRSHN
jgi:hypothetical protein